uniref:Uncharacterized protein n=1 Tax=Panagrolaimus sp. PS1159 TaxID=55785 RepID=A0AC35FTF9_9BILA
MDVASTTTASTVTPATQSSSRKRKIDDDATANPFAAFQNIMNMSQLFGQFTNENSENGSMDFNNALAALNSGDLQNFLTEHLTQQQPSSAHSSPASSPRASPLDETCDEPKTGRSLRLTLEADGLDLIEQFFANIASVKHNIDRIPTSEIPELCKVDCPNCDTVFPSIWILKKHAEDAHAVSLPLEAVQQFSEKLKQALDDLTEQNQTPDIKRQKIEEITNNLKAGKLNGTSANSKTTKKSSLSKIEEAPSTSPSMDSSNMSNLAMMSMLTGSNFPMLMNPFLSMMNPEMLATAAASQSNGSNNNGSVTTVSSPGCGGDFSSLTGQQRRARTKITDDQLKVLKTYFDISNSPTEQQVKEMAMKTGLLEKVIKHWFRNTLFKERQRDKDSPYNFNVPPQLSIDLDAYEKTGEAKIKPFKCEENEDNSNVSTPAPSTPIQMPQLEIKKEPKFQIKQEPKLSLSIDPNSAAAVNSQTAAFVSAASEFMANLNKACNNNFNPFALLSQAAMAGGTPTNTDKSFNDMLASSTSLDLTSPLPSATPNGNGAGSGGGSGSGRRANRTRFTDIQLRSLQQFFDKQAYPKDDDLEMLSKKLNLSPRVIVVWFQNARQKARKIYENTPNMDNNERFVRTPGQNFQCKRCQLVFPRYYELIQHQQKVCYVNDNDAQQNDNKFVEEMMSDDEKPTTSYDNTSSATVNITTGDPLTISSGSTYEQISPSPNQSTMETLTQLLNGTTSDVGAEEDKDESTKDIPMLSGTIASSDDLLKFLTGKCDNATLNKLLESTSKQQQQQLEDFSNDQAPLDLSTSPTFLQDEPTSNNHSRRESSLNYLDTDFDFSTVMSSVSPTNFPSMLANTFFSSTGSTGSPHQQRSPSATSMSNQHGANKRYRTHLTPLQVYVMKALFNDYKTPSMTECDILGKEIGLNKRVVQVWFQNARAKERKCRNVTGDEDLPKTNNDSCSMCGIDFNSRTPKLTMQDHIFTKRHIGFLSERFNSRSTSQSSNPGRHDGSLSPPPQLPEAPSERVRARAVRDSGSRKPSSNNPRPSSTNSQFPFNLMYGLQSGTLPHLMCDPSILGTPIAALQIPQAVMQQIQIDIQAGKDSTKFTQDGLDLKDLKAKLSDDDFKCVTTVTNEVGYACPGCSYTFQQQAQLEAHQKIICQNFEGKIFKLLQIHYECIACNTKTGTQDDFKKHIESQTHQQIRNLFIQPVIENFLTSSAM